MKRLLLAIGLMLGTCAASQAAPCNPPSGFLVQNGPITIGDLVIYGPACGEIADSGGTGSTPVSFPIFHPSSGNLTGAGCAGSAAHILWWVDQNVCSTADVWSISSSDPSGLLGVNISGTVTVGDTLTMTFTFNGLCPGPGGCVVSYTTVPGDTLAKIAQNLTCAIANNTNLFTLNGATCTAGVISIAGPQSWGGYGNGRTIGYVVPAGTLIAMDVDNRSAIKLVNAVTGAGTEVMTITQATNCAVQCVMGWDNNPVIECTRTVTNIAPPPNSVICEIQVGGTQSSTPNTLSVQYGNFNVSVLSSTTGAIKSRFGLITPDVNGNLNQGAFVGAGIYTTLGVDLGPDTISAANLIGVTSSTGATPSSGTGWFLIGGNNPISSCINWSTGTFLPCLFQGSTFNFRPNNANGISILATVLRSDVDAAYNLGTGSFRWINVASQLFTSSSANGSCTMGTSDSIICNSAQAFFPQFNISQTTADANGAGFIFSKSRNLTNTLAGDGFLDFQGQAWANGALRTTTRWQFIQTGASSGSNVPAKMVWTTSNALGQINQSMTFDSAGHLSLVPSIAPTVGACGTGPAIAAGSTDNAGSITVGTAAPASCVVNFGVAFSVAPRCVVASQTQLAAFSYVVTTTTITVTQTATSSNVITWACGLNTAENSPNENPSRIAALPVMRSRVRAGRNVAARGRVASIHAGSAIRAASRTRAA